MCPAWKSAESRPHLGPGGLGGLSEPAQVKPATVSWLAWSEQTHWAFITRLTGQDTETSAGAGSRSQSEGEGG